MSSYFLVLCCPKSTTVEEYPSKAEMEAAIEKRIRDRANLPNYVIKGKRFDYTYLIKVKLDGEDDG